MDATTVGGVEGSAVQAHKGNGALSLDLSLALGVGAPGGGNAATPRAIPCPAVVSAPSSSQPRPPQAAAAAAAGTPVPPSVTAPPRSSVKGPIGGPMDAFLTSARPAGGTSGNHTTPSAPSGRGVRSFFGAAPHTPASLTLLPAPGLQAGVAAAGYNLPSGQALTAAPAALRPGGGLVARGGDAGAPTPSGTPMAWGLRAPANTPLGGTDGAQLTQPPRTSGSGGESATAQLLAAAASACLLAASRMSTMTPESGMMAPGVKSTPEGTAGVTGGTKRVAPEPLSVSTAPVASSSVPGDVASVNAMDSDEAAAGERAAKMPRHDIGGARPPSDAAREEEEGGGQVAGSSEVGRAVAE